MPKLPLRVMLPVPVALQLGLWFARRTIGLSHQSPCRRLRLVLGLIGLALRLPRKAPRRRMTAVFGRLGTWETSKTKVTARISIADFNLVKTSKSISTAV